jgi:type IV secretion system protein TrbH
MRVIIIMSAALLVSACASPGPWGNYADARPGYNAQMAEDAYKQLAAVYPPAKTHLTIDHPVDDPFGILLIGKLRRAGYAVEESKPATSKGSKGHGSNAPNQAAPTVAGLPFHYVVDRIASTGYRVSLRVGGQALNRVYQSSGSELAPAGYWAKQE